MKHSYPQGYILKAEFEDEDSMGHYISSVHLPGTPEEEIPYFSFKDVVLKQKYTEELRIDPNKIRDLCNIRLALGAGGNWIDELAQRQSTFIGPFNEHSEDVDAEIEEPTLPKDHIADLDNIYTIEPVQKRVSIDLESP